MAKATETMAKATDVMAKTLEPKWTEIVTGIKANVESVEALAKVTDVKLESAIEAKLVESLGRQVESSVEGKVKSMKDDVAETMEIEKRRNNIVFHGVKETEVTKLDSLGDNVLEKSPDLELVEEILKSGLRLDASRHIEEVQRIGRYTRGKIRSLRVRIKTFEARNEILRRARELKESEEFKKVFIAPDLTRKQQATDKDLREHVKKFRDEGQDGVKIKSGKVVKNGPENQVVFFFFLQTLHIIVQLTIRKETLLQ